MKDVAAAIVIALLVYLGACFVSFEPDVTRWSEYARCMYLLASFIGFSFWKINRIWVKK